MLEAIDVAMYFIQKDIDKSLFNTHDLMTRNNRTFYCGNARLNKYLHLAQNIYLAKTGNLLMNIDLYAYDNGAVSPNIQENYAVLLMRSQNYKTKINNEEKIYLDKFFEVFKSSEIDELIQLSHEDIEWENKNHYYSKSEQKMDSLKYKDVYVEQYKDIVKMLDRISL